MNANGRRQIDVLIRNIEAIDKEHRVRLVTALADATALLEDYKDAMADIAAQIDDLKDDEQEKVDDLRDRHKHAYQFIV